MNDRHGSPTLYVPLFDIEGEHNFLISPKDGKSPGCFTDEEKRALYLWQKFYVEQVQGRNLYSNTVHWRFKKVARENGLDLEELFVHTEKDGSKRSRFRFHDKPITFLQVANRVFGGFLMYSEAERRAAFKEVVGIYEDEHGEGRLPKWQDFDRYRTQKRFLEEVGIVVISRDNYEYYLPEQFDTAKIENFYRHYFDIPGDMTRAELEDGLKRSDYTISDLVDNYADVHYWMIDTLGIKEENAVPTRQDITRYFDEHQKIAIPWKAYSEWIYGNNSKKFGRMPIGQKPSLEWLRNKIGINTKASLERKRKVGVVDWEPQKMKPAFIAVWKTLNPNGFRQEVKLLVDPPTTPELDKFASGNPKLVDPDDPEVIHDVPTAKNLLTHYPDGYPGMLKDIEDEYSADGILFTKRRSVIAMNTVMKRNGTPPNRVPKAVADYIQKSGRVIQR